MIGIKKTTLVMDTETKRELTLFIITMCTVCGVSGFLLGFAACAIAGAI